jgi:hypothetical protein
MRAPQFDVGRTNAYTPCSFVPALAAKLFCYNCGTLSRPG